MADEHAADTTQATVEAHLGKRVTAGGDTPMERVHRMSRQMRSANIGDAVQTGVPVAGDTIIVTATKLASRRYHVALTTQSVALHGDEYGVGDQGEYALLCDLLGDGLTQMFRLGGAAAVGETKNISL